MGQHDSLLQYSAALPCVTSDLHCTTHTGAWSQSNAVPYATTTLVAPAVGSIPNPQAYMIQPGGGSGSAGENNCVRTRDSQEYSKQAPGEFFKFLIFFL